MQQVQLGPVEYSGFPVRSLTKKLNGEGGEWITAYRVEQKKRFKTTISQAEPESSLTPVIRPPTNTREGSSTLSSRTPVLNREYLLHHCYVNEPNDLSVANISGEGLEKCVPEDLAQFNNVVHLNAADNKLPLESLSHFPSLEGLELPLNGLMDVQLTPDMFPCLVSLDLSYNSLSGLAVIELGLLSALRELHLTGNNLVALPVEMTRPYKLIDGGCRLRFPALEQLWLDDNKLSDQSTFATLAGLRRLKYLNLDNNEIYSIPQLKLLGSSPLKQLDTVQTSLEQQDTNLLPSDQHSTSNGACDTAQESDGDHNEPDMNDNSHQEVIDVPHITADRESGETRSQTKVLSNDDGSEQSNQNQSNSDAPHKNSKNTSNYVDQNDRSISIGESLQSEQHSKTKNTEENSISQVENNSNQKSTPPHDQHTKSSVHRTPTLPQELQYSQTDTMSAAPFPELEALSLINNLILSPEGVLACESWPVLRKLLIYDNPFISTYKGMPPILQQRMVNQCGIKVVRKKPKSGNRHLIGNKAKEFKKVSIQPPPPIPKCPLPALEPPPLDHKTISHTPSISRTHSSNRSFSPHESNSTLGSILDSEGSQQGVFMTQVTGDEPDHSPPVDGVAHQTTSAQTISVQEEFEARLREVRERYRDVPEKYKGFELLLDVQDDPHTKIPKDLHSCVRALRHALSHPLSIGAKPPVGLSGVSTFTTSHPPGNYLKKKPPSLEPLPPVRAQGKIEEIRRALDGLRTQCTTLETNLSLALEPSAQSERKKTSSQLQKESKQLLAEMQACYDRVRASSLRAVTVEERQSTGKRSVASRRVRFNSQALSTSPSSSKHSRGSSRDSTV